MPAHVREGTVPVGDRHDWGVEVTVTGDRRGPLGRGRVVAGSSQINDRSAPHPPPGDFAEWAALGLLEWGWDGMLPAFRAVENDLEFGGSDAHRDSGPVPITGWRRGDLLPAMAGARGRATLSRSKGAVREDRPLRAPHASRRQVF